MGLTEAFSIKMSRLLYIKIKMKEVGNVLGTLFELLSHGAQPTICISGCVSEMTVAQFSPSALLLL